MSTTAALGTVARSEPEAGTKTAVKATALAAAALTWLLVLVCAGCRSDGSGATVGSETPAPPADGSSAPGPAVEDPGETAPGSSPTAPAAREVELGVGESGTVGGLELTLLGVSGDSRCPVDVTCVWQGDAVATVHARAEGAEETFEIHLNIEPRSTVVEGRRVTFRGLAPPAVEGREIPTDAYRATFLVEPV